MHILIKFLSTQTSSLHVPQTYKQTMHHVAYISISLWWFSPFNQQLISLSLNFFSRSPFHNTNSSSIQKKKNRHTHIPPHSYHFLIHSQFQIHKLSSPHDTTSNSSKNEQKKVTVPAAIAA